MSEPSQPQSKLTPVGYEALLRQYGISVIPNWHRSFIAQGGSVRTHVKEDVTEAIYPPKYWPGESAGEQLEFSLKYDGTNLAILAQIFQVVPREEMVAFFRSKPTGKYARRLWYLYEFLTGQTLPLDDLARGNYIDLLDPEEYYTAEAARPVRRQRINDNLLGEQRFCPTIRRTARLEALERADLPQRCRRVVAAYPPELLKRALSYLYTKETKSSFEIEHIEPDATRTERFVALLELAVYEDFCEKGRLVDLQNRIVDPRFRERDYRTSQNYVGESVAWGREKIHFASPRQDDLVALMEGLLAAHRWMEMGRVSPVIHAAAVSFGFVYLHPFEDGNGRIHRFLIHNILARRKFTPSEVMFPVSAAMLKYRREYDDALEAFSRPLMPLVDYALDDEGRMTVHNDTAMWYRYMDMTAQAEALFAFVERTIDTELVEELDFLASYDEAKVALREVVDMPDRKIDLFIRFCLQNQGRLAARKRNQFDFLSDGEVARMEQAVRIAYGIDEPEAP